jgi:hypothetical protein
MAVQVIARVWPFNILAGAGIAGDDDESAKGRSAGRIVSVKSNPAVKSTRDEGKNCTEVTVLRWDFGILREGVRSVVEMRMEPSLKPVANWVPSGEISKAVMR